MEYLRFQITAQVISAVKSAHAKYFANMKRQRFVTEKEKKQEVLQQPGKAAQKSNKKELDEVEASIEILESNIQIADAIIQEGITNQKNCIDEERYILS